MSAELLRDIFLPCFPIPSSTAWTIRPSSKWRSHLAFTTDSFVVHPLFFPGGDIGSLAVHGTVNDLAMGGARPLYLSAGFIIEEGFSTEALRRIAASMAEAAAAAGVTLSPATRKLSSAAKAMGFINTTESASSRGVRLSANQARPGDRVILSGTIGDHGIAIMAKREGLEFETDDPERFGALHNLVARCYAGRVSNYSLSARPHARWSFERPQRNCANRASASRSRRTRIPVRDEVRGACELLGLDPLYVANEGKLWLSWRPKTRTNSLPPCGVIRGARSRSHRDGWQRNAGLDNYEDRIRIHSHCGHAGRRTAAEDLLMHEMGIASSIMEAAWTESRLYPGNRAAKVGVVIGEFAGVDRESLRFCFETLANGLELDITLEHQGAMN